MVSPHSSLSIDDDGFAPYEVIGEVGARPQPVYVGRPKAIATPMATMGGHLVVIERFAGAVRAGHGAAGDLRREARRLSALANPHLARIREVALRGDDLVVFGDFIDGEKLLAFWPSTASSGARGPLPFGPLPLEIALRILLDVLAGVGALHALRDANQQPMKLTHGEISPATILFGADGVARVLHAVARRAPDVRPAAASLGYLAPEAHAGDVADGRADVFSVGVLLWEILSGVPLSPDGAAPGGLRAGVGPLPLASVPEKTPWAKALVPVVAKALAAAPEDRWTTTAAMAAEIRKAAGLKLAAASAAAAFAKMKFGDHVKERRARWERASRSQAPGPASSVPVLAGHVSTLAPPFVPIFVPVLAVAAPTSSSAPALASASAPAPAPLLASALASALAPASALASASAPAFASPRALAPALSSDPPLPFASPVAIDEAAFALASDPPPPPEPIPAISSSPDAADPRLRSARRRALFVGGGAATTLALVVALVALHGAPPATATGAPLLAPPPVLAAAASIPGAAAASPPASSLLAGAPSARSTGSAASTASSAPPKSPKSDRAAKSKTGAPHTKGLPVRDQSRAKPGSH